MKIICDSCGASQSPAAIWHDGARVALECASCHLIAEVVVAQSVPGAEPILLRPASVAESSEIAAAAATPAPSGERVGATAPHPEGDAQCQKCGHRQDKVESCDSCGFVFANYKAGTMPWDQIPEGKEEAWAKAEALWGEAVGTEDEDAHRAFMTHCMANELESLAGRKLRFRLADQPADSIVARQLSDMLERGQATLLARMQATKSDLQNQASALKKNLLWMVFIVGLALALGFIWLYPNLFSR